MDILVVTSVPDLGRLIGEVLAGDGHVPRLACTGAAASQAFVQALPDLAIIDVRLSDVSGVDLLRSMRALHAGAGVSVLILADDATATEGRVAPHGVERVLAKPISLLDLSDLVRGVACRRGAFATPEAPARAVVAPPVLARQVVAPSRADPAPERHDAADVAQLLLRLRREARVVERADPWTVLGLPAGSGWTLVQQAAERLRARYGAFATSENAEVRRNASLILSFIEDALDALPAGGGRPPPHAEGLALAAAGEWSRADAWFTTARDLAPDSAACLAHLGWARFHNPDLARSEREEDGLALVELALQFDARLVEAHVYLATLATRRGDARIARGHLDRALRIEPTNPTARKMLAGLAPA